MQAPTNNYRGVRITDIPPLAGGETVPPDGTRGFVESWGVYRDGRFVFDTPQQTAWQEFFGRLSSRKFLTWVVAVIAAFTAYASGQLDSTALITGIVAATASYQAAEGITDVARRSQVN